MKKNIRLGVVCLARNTFDFAAAEQLYGNILKDLQTLDSVEVCAVKQLVMEVSDAIKAASELYDNRVDGIAVISGTFHLGHLVLEIKKRVDKPLLLWGLPELPYNGGKIRLNSVCGVNLNASNLVKSGINDFTYIIDGKIDENWLDAVRMTAALRSAKVGILGYRAHGFFNLDVDELALYRKFGLLIDHYELEQVWNYAADEKQKQVYAEMLRQRFDVSGISASQLERVAELSVKLKTFIDDNGLTALAVRCWPEFAAGYGIAPCAAMSLLQSLDVVLACEGDIDCALTMLCHRAAGAETPFMADLSQVNLKEDHALMWHCGVAPANLCDGKCAATLDTYFAGGKGVTAGFVMKSGAINMARLDSVNGHYRLFQQKGEALPMEKLLTGTYAKARFDRPMKEVLDKVIYSGVAHHVSMVYGDFTQAMLIFARLSGIEVL
ncbi:MAG: fucose isomerase [Clostridia bacterium]|nr:fucose isomerase [Clostridia bacterium]